MQAVQPKPCCAGSGEKPPAASLGRKGEKGVVLVEVASQTSFKWLLQEISTFVWRGRGEAPSRGGLDAFRPREATSVAKDKLRTESAS